MRALRGSWRVLRFLAHGLHGLAVVLLVFPLLDRAGRRRRIRWWAGKTLAVLGIRLRGDGRLRPGAKLLVANHISWLDVMVVHALCPEARFVSKAEVRNWPLAARLVDSAETLYLERDRRRDALRVVHQMAEVMRAGDTVAVFPEGTTGAGRELLPFHANLLQAAISTAVPVQPLALRYADRAEAVSRAAEFVGPTTMVKSLWMLACADGMIVHLEALAARETAHADRRALAARLREDIRAALAAIDQAHRPS